jgi:cob(I)alamin adenosyltransferase
MKIYTKKGDQGETGLLGGERVAKDHLRIATYGTIDELNACLGLALSLPMPEEKAAGKMSSETISSRLTRIQSELFQVGAELATPFGKKTTSPCVEEVDVQHLEQEIDSMEAQLQPLKNFILPGGTQLSAALHLARTVSRRAERELITLHRAEPCRLVVLEYMNRLSDYLFVMARFANQVGGGVDTPWIARKS